MTFKQVNGGKGQTEVKKIEKDWAKIERRNGEMRDRQNVKYILSESYRAVSEVHTV